MLSLIILAALAIFVLLAFFRATAISWVLAMMVIVPVVAIQARLSETVLQLVYVLLFSGTILFAVPYLRRAVISRLVFRQSVLASPPSERVNIGWERDLYTGHPDWNKLLAYPAYALNESEQLFLDTEVDSLCAMLDEWEITSQLADLPPEVWQLMKEKGFFGLTIPKRYGGLAFSAQAYSAVLGKIASRSPTVAAVLKACNAPGASGLLLRYGTEAQKNKYLHRLACGQEVPCFCLPAMGEGTGVVCKGEFSGRKKVLGIRLSWDKRDVPMAPLSTLLGLAFNLYDPEGLLGKKRNPGMTLALIPTYTPGVQIGRRHIALNAALLHGPTTGQEVFIPLEYIIGGAGGAGQGDAMLAAGMDSSLVQSACNVGSMKLAAFASGAYCRVLSSSGVDESLARIAAATYMLDAVHRLAAQAEDRGEPVVFARDAAAGYERLAINEAMTVHRDKAACLGPGNYLAGVYQQLPVITDHSNTQVGTLGRLMQGAISSHPYVLQEMSAACEPDRQRALQLYDDALFGHIGYVLSNMARSFVFGLFGARGIPVPAGEVSRRYYQQLTRFSVAFSLSADVLLTCGLIKHPEKFSVRLGEVLSGLYLCSATLKRFSDEGSRREDAPLLHWAMQDGLYRIQSTLTKLIQNIPNRLMRGMLQALIFPIGRNFVPPSDKLTRKVAALLMQDSDSRDRLTAGIYRSGTEQEPLVALHAALVSTIACEALQQKLLAACQSGRLTAYRLDLRIKEARAAGIITATDAELLVRNEHLRRQVLRVDDFATDEL